MEATSRPLEIVRRSKQSMPPERCIRGRRSSRGCETLTSTLSGTARRSAAAEQSPGSAITGLRLDDETLAEGRLPDRHLLDEISTEQPILLMRYCGHIAVANTRALDVAGIGPDTADPTGGVIDRDDFQRICYETLTEAAEHNVRYREMFFNPTTHMAAGVDYDTCVDGLIDGINAARADHGIECRLIGAINRMESPELGIE